MLTSLKMDTITAGRGVWDQIMEQVAIQVSRGQVAVQVSRDQVEDQVCNQVWDQVEDEVAVQVFMQVRAGVSLDAY